MIKNYKFNYDYHEAKVELEVDTNVFDEEKAKVCLDFFVWDYDEDEDPIDAYMKKLAIQCIIVATTEQYNAYGVVSHFTKGQEGFPRLDGSDGIKLIAVESYEFNEDKFEIEITENAEPKPLPRALIE